MEDLKKLIRNVQDFPKKGIGFKDITTLLQNGSALVEAVDQLAALFADKEAELIIGVESRGFIFGTALACKLGLGFIPVRKPGKLPAETIREEYQLEYGTDAIEMHQDAIQKGQKVLVIDDLLATGGTVLATTRLVERMGGDIVGVGFLIELDFLKGRDKISQYNVKSLVHYDSE